MKENQKPLELDQDVRDLKRIKVFLKELKRRAFQSSEEERKKLFDRFMSLVENRANYASNMPLITMINRELMNPLSDPAWLHEDMKERLLKRARLLRRRLFDKRS